ncbi:hypothetical protein J4050_12010 [Winogradskyella sp. DF17]|uniref:Alpha-L-glutamate ligase-related protein ATP-grasp domain-containing protein n=1 Tax=Winogradskyella pelagia TaxID=2819984 RepID=A0ABS3T405_9FLAO|nr:sugar-transfer associated ATP-grasp domain-containing protein [Winogradskyella sp. DF17]MBO3117478.1 hypothetical protein [Winogradskyella sp. DF17]
MKKKNLPKLSKQEIKEAKLFFKARGYTLKNTYWHKYYKGLNGEFHKDYIPYDIFRPYIDGQLNQRRLWPALQDKNLSYKLFWEFNQPKSIVQNINGFYFINEEFVGLNEAVTACAEFTGRLIIKPTVETGGGKMVNTFKVIGSRTNFKDFSLEELFQFYGKDFVVQEFLEQSPILKALNPTSLNTLRLVTYINDTGAHILASVLRIGKVGHSTDNFSTGGFFCGITEKGLLKGKGYNPKDKVVTVTETGIELKDYRIPNYDKVKDMVTSMHHVVPYFKIISWDIGINKDNLPFLIEYNALGQGVDLQIANGPFLGDFTDEILELSLSNS